MPDAGGTGGGIAGSGGGLATGGGAGGGSGGGATGGGSADAGHDAGPAPGTATLTGDLAFTAREADAVLPGRADAGADRSLLQVSIFSAPLGNVCTGAADSGFFEGLALAFLATDGGEVRPGTLAVGPALAASRASLTLNDAGFALPISVRRADAGTATLTTFDAARAVGTFAVAFGLDDGGTAALSGTFDTPVTLCR